MPPTRHVSKQQSSPPLLKDQNQFKFPTNNHLLVTTASHIYARDSTGIHTIFRSSKNSIVAAREAKDDSGVLAVAAKHVVVLHDTRRGQERSWGLNADEDEVRHLEYTADAKLLFLTTTLTADIQRYSTERSRLLAPSRAHASPPNALAISPTGHLLVSASDKPPAVYLKDLKQNGQPILIEPQASDTAVSKIAFHPERPNVFLLAFRDGTVASFDATKINRNLAGSFSNQEKMNAGEISRLPRLHRTTSNTLNSASVSDAAFLPGYKTRAITTGSDGRCRLVDFADGGIVLRTWHAKAPVSSIAILSQKTEANTLKRTVSSRSSHVIGGPTSTNNLIAIGRADGKVHIYDSLGLLLDQKAFSDSSERIISVEWSKGRAPKPISDSIISKNVNDLSGEAISEGLKAAKDEEVTKVPLPKQNVQGRRETMFEHVGLPPALRKPKDVPNSETNQPPRRFTIHPDEVEDGTVRHNPASRPVEAGPLDQKNYLDLFSPVKPPDADTELSPVKRLASPPRTRPRLSPQTFVKSPEPVPAGQHSSVSKPRNLALFPSTGSGSETPHLSANDSAPKVFPLQKSTRITFKTSSVKLSRRASPYRITKPSPNQNANVLADLRKLTTGHPTHRSSGTLAAFAQSKPAHLQYDPGLKGKKRGLFRRPTDHVETDLDSDVALKAYEHVHRKYNWPEDSNQDSSLDGDIWLTSNSDDDTTRMQRRRKHPVERPPARQTSRSRINSKGTMSTIGQTPDDLHVEPKMHGAVVDGSTEDGMETARTNLSQSGAFSPSSNDVRELFPRTSSLSPKKGKRSGQRLGTTAESLPPALREVSLNSLARGQAKSPWARAQAGRNKQERDVVRGEQKERNIAAHEGQPHCDVCGPTRKRVKKLEGEVARLKGEVIALKAMLRRNDIPLPLPMR